MKKLALLPALLLAAAGYVYLQTTPPAPKLAAFLPSGAAICLEARDFGRLLRDWDGSPVKSDWLASDDYAVFSRSNLFTKLSEVYDQYGEAAGFAADLEGLIGIAGDQSALALYNIRNVEFLYVTRIADSTLAASALWAARTEFEQRQAGGVTFYLRTDEATKRTVAFATAKGYLLVATRDDLVAQSLELLAGAANPNIASDPWYRDASAQAQTPGELRMTMNLESLVKSDYFRSYWVQRNTSDVRRYSSGVADVTRAAGSITETRVFLRAPAGELSTVPGTPAIPGLLALVPPDAGVYRAAPVGDAASTASLIVGKLIGSPPQRSRDWRDAPYAVSPDERAGSEASLETRIDEQPLPPDAGISDSVAAVTALLNQAGAQASLLVQSSSPASGTFVQLPAVVVVASTREWDRDLVRRSLAAAAGKLWTTSQLGAGWTPATIGRHTGERLDGLGGLAFTIEGPLLFLANDTGLLASVLDRAGSAAAAQPLTYAAGFRHLRERSNYERIMAALDFGAPGHNGPDAPTFFSGNIGSLSRVLAGVAEVGVTEEDRGRLTLQTVRYQLRP